MAKIKIEQLEPLPGVSTDVIWNSAGDIARGTGLNTADVLSIGSGGAHLRSNGTSFSWSTATYPDTAAQGDLQIATLTNNWDSLPIGLEGEVLTVSAGGLPEWAAGGGGGVIELSDLSDVNTSTPTNRFVLVADGVDFESRLLVEADISDLGTYLTGNQSITLSGDVTGTGTTAITTVIAAGAVDIAMLSATGTADTTTFLGGDNVWNVALKSLTVGNSTFVDLQNVGTANIPDITATLSATGTPSASTYLRGDNTWATVAGGGDVTKVGTPVDNQVGVWTGDGTIEGDPDFTYSNQALSIGAATTSPSIILDKIGTGTSTINLRSDGGVSSSIQLEFNEELTIDTIATGNLSINRSNVFKWTATSLGSIASTGGALAQSSASGVPFAHTVSDANSGIGGKTGGITTLISSNKVALRTLPAGTTINVELVGELGSFGATTAGEGVIRINDVTRVPEGTLTSGGLLYVSGTGLFFLDDGGTATQLNAAGGSGEQSKTIVIEAPADADYLPIFRTDVAITIQEALGGLMAAGSVQVRLYWDTDFANTSPNAIGTATTLTTTSEASINIATDATIPANSWIFVDVGTVSTPQTTAINIRYTQD